MDNSSATNPTLELNASRPDNVTADSYGNEMVLSELSAEIYLAYILRLFTPIIFLTGCFGNTMTIIIMQRLKTEGSVIDLYFTATAVMDTVVLCTRGMEDWVEELLDWSIYNWHLWSCKIMSWISYGSDTTSCWYVVCLTVHRALSVVWPHRVNLYTRRRVVMTLMGITFFFYFLYFRFLIDMKLLYTDAFGYLCVPVQEITDLVFWGVVQTKLEPFVYSFLPFIILVLSNGVLIWNLRGSVKMADRHGDSAQLQAREKSARSVNRTVVIISISFLLLTLPSTTVGFLYNLEVLETDSVAEASFVDHSLYTVIGLLGDVNHAVNFYLYILTGRKFREEFIKVMCWGRRRRERQGGGAATGR